MAKVCVDSGVLGEGRFAKLSRELGKTREETAGLLLCFWNDSQERRMVYAKREEITDLLTDGQKAFDALLRNKYLSEQSDGTFEIKGNRSRLIDTGAQPQDLPAKKIRPAKPKEPGPSVELVATYNDEFQRLFKKSAPPAGARERSQLVMLTTRYGRDKALELIKFYFTMSDGFYRQNFYPIGVLVSQSHRIFSAMTTGLNLTRARVQRMERSQDIQQTLMDIEQGAI